VGYELLFRGGYVHDAPIDDPEKASATVVMNALTELDLGRIAGGKTPWVNVSSEFILGGLAEAVPPGVVGLELTEDDLQKDGMLDALRTLKVRGYKLGVDHFRNQPGSDQMLHLFDVIKLSMTDLGREQMTEHLARLLKTFDGTIVAEKISTREDHDFCVAAGFDHFQGFFFCKPAVVATKGVAANRLALLQVLAALQNPNIELREVEELIKHDVALSYRLLRYVNSAYFGLRSEVRSIGQALALLGVENARRWATLSVLASIDNKPTELTMTALIRARFCELAGDRLSIGSAPEMFTLGLFSVIDAMMDSPMLDVVESLPFAEDMREALALRRGARGMLLDTVSAIEHGEEEDASVVVPQAGDLYLDALMWANTAAESLFGTPGRGGEQPAAAAGTASASRAESKAPPAFATDPSTSKAPPGQPARTPVGAAPRPGFFSRLFGRLFGRARREQPAPASSGD
jgi:EAL and modified HD-GYP domain-containing signal transduction protein